MATAHSARRAERNQTEAQVRELFALFVGVIKGFKSGREEGRPPELVEAFEGASLGERHLPPLLFLSLEGPMSVGELADTLGLKLATTSLLVGELSRAGLVDRSEDESDRRRKIVSLNEDFRKIAEPQVQGRLGPFRRTLERLAPAARAHFIEGMRVLHEESGGFGRDDADECTPST
jgi:DNA-binding MarR family transcriptional regulator